LSLSSHPQRAAMQRLPLPSTTCFCRAVLTLTVGLGSTFFASDARADEFSLVPKGDPIYSQLSSLARPGDGKVTPALTRYEAALQTARAIMDLRNRDLQSLSRTNWRALKSLATTLKFELRQMGVDVDAAIALADRNLENYESPDLSVPASARRPTRTVAVPLPPSGLLLAPAGLDNPNIKTSSIEIPLSRRLRVGAALTAIQRNANDPFRDDFSTRNAPKNNLQQLGSQSSLAYNLNPSLTVRAANAKVSAKAGEMPLLSAPFLDGASNVNAAGGGLDINLGSGLKLSTEVERLRSDTGAQASRIGGGASVSAFQNRLSMNMSVSRLLSEDDATLPATAAQLGVGLDVTRRLSLSLLYQGLFSQAANSNASRVSGGFSLNF
jgi:hypothetical protein